MSQDKTQKNIENFTKKIEIKFNDIAKLVRQVLEQHESIFIEKPTIDDIKTADAWARDKTMQIGIGDKR